MSAGLIEGYKYDIIALDSASLTDTRLVPKLGSVSLRRKGATVTVPGGTAGGIAVIAVSDIGSVVEGDTIQVNGVGVPGTVEPGYTQTSVTINWAGAASWTAGARLVIQTPGSNPIAYTDQRLTNILAQPFDTNVSTGSVSFYTRMQDLDYFLTIGGVPYLITDQAGLGGQEEIKLGQWDGRGDGAFDNRQALLNAIARAKASTGGVIKLGPGEWRVGGADVDLSSLAGCVFRGEGKGVTKLLFTSDAARFMVSLCADVAFEDMTIGRTVSGSQALFDIAATCFRTKFNDCHFTKGNRAAIDRGTDTHWRSPTFDGDGWAGGILCVGAKRPYIDHPVARYANNLPGGTGFLEFDGPCDNPIVVNPDIAPSDLTQYTGTAAIVKSTQGGTGPSNVVFEQGRMVGGDKAGSEKPAVQVLAASGGGSLEVSLVRFVGTLLEDSLQGAHVTGGKLVRFEQTTVAGVRQNGVLVDSGNNVQFIGHTSSNVSEQGDGLFSHVKVNNVNGLKVDGLTYGNLVRTAGVRGLHAVEIGNAVTPPWMVKGVEGQIFALTGTDVSDATLPIVGPQGRHVSHNMRTVAGVPFTSEHESVAWVSRVFTAGATPVVAGLHTVECNYAAPTTLTDFTAGVEDQEIYVVNVGANAITLQHAGGGNLRLRLGVNLVLNQNMGCRFTKKGTLWIEG